MWYIYYCTPYADLYRLFLLLWIKPCVLSFFLQFYCSHLHILCSFKGHGLLTLFPHVPILNHIMVTGIFFLVVHQITGAEYAFMGILKPSPPGSFPTKDCPPNADAPQHAWCVNVSYFHVEELNTWTMA